MNTRKKGLSKELACAKALEREGYEVFFRSTTVKRGPCWVGLDFAHIFDLIAGKSGYGWRFVSCKAGTDRGGIAEDRRQILQFASQHSNAFKLASFELWTWHKAGLLGRGKERKRYPSRWKWEYVASVPSNILLFETRFEEPIVKGGPRNSGNRTRKVKESFKY